MPPIYQGHLSAGASHSLLATAKGELLAWGLNGHGQVGDGTVVDRDRPVQILPGGVRAVAGGKAHSLAVTVEGELWAWGCNENGFLGTGWTEKQLTPVRLLEGNIQSVAAGARHSLALTEYGEVLGWGLNDYGQVGVDSKGLVAKPTKVELPLAATAIAAGWYHSLALLENGSVYAWGFNSTEGASFRSSYQPVRVILRSIASIAAGGVHSLALTTGGIVLAWGGNEKCQLGDGTTTRQSIPVPVADKITHIDAGAYHSVAVRDDDQALLTWGWFLQAENKYGQNGAWVVQPTPRMVPMDPASYSFWSCCAGDGHCLAVSMYGEVFAWGGNCSGQVGDRSKTDRLLPWTLFATGTMKLRSNQEILSQLMDGSPKAVDDALEEGSRPTSRSGPKFLRSVAESMLTGSSPDSSPKQLRALPSNTTAATLSPTPSSGSASNMQMQNRMQSVKTAPAANGIISHSNSNGNICSLAVYTNEPSRSMGSTMLPGKSRNVAPPMLMLRSAGLAAGQQQLHRIDRPRLPHQPLA
eukprot:CAMPEP_0206547556 /NCGR_PEP_ID=MMETSP0325_2-20121206/13363_1 /ASSEMBLY_ACC=CAM_ASM_000347 /TAXON_ID=2866 /ORGANISM="Crypthecodinium cohnii, Strain Seligo" /LENGTH=525 /DNA_ID=CAMNT_0054046877 /DNA_START=655 /DNA_END=2229 /DNA_ORIENTATION=+